MENPDGVESGVAELEIDGESVDGQTIPPFRDGETHDVWVVMG